jgi:hypothetical protein
MWQPRPVQWWLIVAIAALVVFGWPPTDGRSLGMKLLNRAVDPAGSLPELPPPLAMGLDDNGDVVTEHDQQVTAYFDRYNSSAVTRWRMDLKEANDPWNPSTGRQVLVGIAVFGALVVWRLNRG